MQIVCGFTKIKRLILHLMIKECWTRKGCAVNIVEIKLSLNFCLNNPPLD